MPAPTRPDGNGGNYDRWTFDRWAATRGARKRPHRGGRAGRLLACAGAILLCALVWGVERHEKRLTSHAPPATPGGPGTLAGVVVVLDPGHGGEDPGASLRWGRQRVQEAALTYRTALEVARALRSEGADVRYTVRSRMLADDWDRVEPTPTLPLDAVLAATGRPLTNRLGRSPRLLWQRAAVARRAWDGAAQDPRAGRDVFFLSLHFDEFHNPMVRGGSVCVDPRAGPPPAFGLALARSLTAHGWGRPDEAADGQPALAAAELGVLNPRFNPVPQKALLELATLSNLDDCLCATDPAWRAQVARAVAQAVTQVHEAG